MKEIAIGAGMMIAVLGAALLLGPWIVGGAEIYGAWVQGVLK